MAPLCGWRERPACLRMAWNETLASREHLVTFANGHPAFQMLLRPTNYDGEDNWRRLLLEQEYAYQVALLRTVVSQLVEPSDCVALDVGANSGYVSLAAASLGCRVVAVEANPSTAKNARRSFALNGAVGRRIALHNTAIGTASGAVSFAVRHGGGSIFDRVLTEAEAAMGAPSGFHLVRVPSAPLHRVLGPRTPMIHVAKLDCEGCEATAIATMAPLLRRRAILVILTEWITSRVVRVSGNASLHAAIAVLERSGYRSLSWSGHFQPLATLADPQTEVGDLFLVHGAIASSLSAKVQRRRDGMLAQWEALKLCRDRPNHHQT